ncbi:MAG: tetraacyldisaccharide 4'-kinase [Candidatus Eisenbacteria bacterium]|nr:tetraacyldisaccharide 4'-kinase [Candidatus Eisenbacteria bacterium]
MSDGRREDRDVEEYPRVAAPLGWLVAAIARARRAAMGGGTRLPVPVISVGNLAVGGTGKTPLVRHLAGWLAEDGRHVAVLSRGYARPVAGRGVSRVSLRGQVEVASWEEAGDEPWLLAHGLPRASVYVARSRVSAGRAAVGDGAEVLLLDDGFQHLGLARDLDVVCLRGDEHRCRVLPAGPLREPRSALRAAGAGVLVLPSRARDAAGEDSDAPEAGSGELAEEQALAARLRALLPADATWATARVGPRSVDLPGAGRSPASTLAGRAVGVVCAIARHERFVATVRALGAHVEAIHARRDHHVFGEEEIDRLRKDLLWVTTEKDVPRLPRWFGAAVLRVGLHFTSGGDELRARVREAAA